MDFKISQLRLIARIMRTGSLSEAAKSLDITVPSASRALKKMQAELNDPLFIRTWKGMVPTERTEHLFPAVQRFLDELDALDEQKPFDPAKLRMLLTIGTADNGIVAILLPVIRHLMKEAPGIQFRLKQLGTSQFERLANGELDFLLYPTSYVPVLPAHFFSFTLFEMSFSILLDRDHPLVAHHREGRAISDADLARYPRIVVKLSDSGASPVFSLNVDPEAAGPVAIELPYFLGAPYFLEGTLNTLILPRKTAELFARHMPGLTAIPLSPRRLQTLTRLIWHERTHRSVQMQWIRSVFRTYAGDVSEAAPVRSGEKPEPALP